MRLVTLTALLFTTACGKPAPPAPAAEAPPPAIVETAAASAPQVAPAPTGPTANVALPVSIERADGTTLSGTVTTLERSIDVYGEDGYTQADDDLLLHLETDMLLKKVAWAEVRSIDIAQGGPDTVDCYYDSNYSPPMYQCVMKTTPTVTLHDGSAFTSSMRHVWRLGLDDGSSESVMLYKLPARAPGRDGDEEDHALYEALKAQVIEAAASAPVRITLDPPAE